MKKSGLLTGLPSPCPASPAAPAIAAGSDDIYAELRTRWRAFQLGGTGDDLDRKNSPIQIYVKNWMRSPTGTGGA